MYLIQNLKIMAMMARATLLFSLDELRRGTFLKNIGSLALRKEIAREMSWAELLEEKSRRWPERVILVYEDQELTYRDMDENANKTANLLVELGGSRGKGVAIFMGNSPHFLYVFAGTQKIGMYSIPVNTSLRGTSLQYILHHSDAEFLVIDEEYLDRYSSIADQLPNLKKVIVNRTPESSNELPRGMIDLSRAFGHSTARPAGAYRPDDICFILYTSGTTGLPKGVLYRYGKSGVKLLSLPAYTLYRKSDILYTCLPLFHGNALLLTVTQGLHRGAKIILAKRFSASRFWDDIRRHGVTAFNTIGAVIPILMKQPERENDRDNRVRFTLSAACPSDQWEKFQKRFGITIYEGYGAVDGGGNGIVNFGTAPVGSIGKPGPGMKYRIVDNDMNDMPAGAPGELIFAALSGGKSVEYYKNDKATNDKIRNGWIFTGDLVRQDKKGFLYFVGRKAEFMRIKGENVSAYEVEHCIMNHPAVQEAAVFAVPSDLAEDEIMACVSAVEGPPLDEAELVQFLKNDLPAFAVPRYVKIVDEFPKTETQRIIKRDLEKAGIVPGTYDAVRGTRIAEKPIHTNDEIKS